MRPLLLACVLLAAASAGPAAAADKLYVEPASGPRMTVDNLKARRRLLGTDWYCIREIVIDGTKVFGGNHCRIKHGEKKTLRLVPGKHQIDFDTISEWGADYEPDVPPIVLSTTVEAGDKDLAVLLRDAEPPEIVLLEASDAPLLAPAPSTATAASPAAAVSTGTAVSTGAVSDPYKALERLKELYDKGVITGDEFKEKKAELLKTIH